MKRDTANDWRCPGRTMAGVRSRLVALLLLTVLPACTTRHMPTWSRVQGVPASTKTEVRLYKDEAPRGSRKLKGRFHSATDDSVTLRLRNGQTRTLQKKAVRKVLTRRPFLKRKPGWIALGVAFAITEFFINIDSGESPTAASERLGGHATITLPTAAAFFYGSRMGGVYAMPPKYRLPRPGNKPPVTKKKIPLKPKDRI